MLHGLGVRQQVAAPRSQQDQQRQRVAGGSPIHGPRRSGGERHGWRRQVLKQEGIAPWHLWQIVALLDDGRWASHQVGSGHWDEHPDARAHAMLRCLKGPVAQMAARQHCHCGCSCCCCYHSVAAPHERRHEGRPGLGAPQVVPAATVQHRLAPHWPLAWWRCL